MADLTKSGRTTTRQVSGFALPGDPVAGTRRALQRPGNRKARQTRKKRRFITPGTIVLFTLMLVFGLYSTGNLPQVDRYGESVVRATQSHNDAVVAAVLGAWPYFAGILGAAAIVLTFLSLLNARRRRSSQDSA